MSIGGSFVYNPCIQSQFLESMFLTDFCYLLPVLIYVAFRSAHPDDATMKDVKKALRDDNINFSQLKYWNASRCRNLSVG